MSKGSLAVFAGLGLLLYYLVPRDGGAAGYAGDSLVEITPDNFHDEVVLSPVPVLAYFWANW